MWSGLKTAIDATSCEGIGSRAGISKLMSSSRLKLFLKPLDLLLQLVDAVMLQLHLPPVKMEKHADRPHQVAVDPALVPEKRPQPSGPAVAWRIGLFDVVTRLLYLGRAGRRYGDVPAQSLDKSGYIDHDRLYRQASAAE